MRLFILCKGMKWAHLPVAGGLYDQHPRFIEQMNFILFKEAEAIAKQNEKDQKRTGTPRKGR